MSAVIMDGRMVSDYLKPFLQAQANELLEQHQFRPALAAIVVGNDSASSQYVKNKRRFVEALGFSSQILRLDASVDPPGILAAINRLNADPEITGILLQLPLPVGIDPFPLFDAIDPPKDIDAVGANSITGFYRGEWGRFVPCTPRGVLTLIDYYKVPVEGMRAAVIGRSDIAGKPTAIILGGRMRNATVTWCHRYTRDLASICREADIVVSCAGAELGEDRYLITADMVKPGSCVIDVGFRRIGPGHFAGDVDFAAVKEVAGWITPNPGGTGPMTVTALMQNLIDAGRYRLGLDRATYPI
ncbi:MAG TPA: bifunctional 5,10-methylenetetrahydrofolate dehydrogenase/5,10-methenyltetrahydrofolate cyclohydrolase [Candidatus Binataceae bacterium]|nr:bifunctional 5,10-methylenetetrahydrofolate dehydrogenase/5,10-methenyltetrahydrofolate cyclohydrolase [Candidatus Binataceae bacterium]